MQKHVEAARAKGAQVVVLLSHNGMDVDLKLASRVTGIDAVLGGHTHDAVPQAVVVENAGGRTIVTNAGSNGKFLGVLDLDVRGGRVADFRYRLLPVFANLLPADPAMAALIEASRAPHAAKLGEPGAPRCPSPETRSGRDADQFEQAPRLAPGRQGHERLDRHDPRQPVG